MAILRVLIVEDTPERQSIFRNLYKDHAWVLVHTVARAVCLLSVFDFDLISLDYNLAHQGRGSDVAAALARSRNAAAKVIVHSMNPQGARLIAQHLPGADIVPLTKIIRNNDTFKRLRAELSKGTDINWQRVFQK